MSIEAELQRLAGRTMTLAEGRVEADVTSVDDGMIEIDFELSTTGESVIVEQLIPIGSVFRLPKAGQLALLGFVDGDRNEGYVIGWISRPENAPAPATIQPGVVYVWAPTGERIRLVTDAGVVVDSPNTQVGGDTAIAPAANAVKDDALWLKFYTMFSTWVPSPADGGLVLKNLFTAAFPTPPESVGFSKLKSE